MFFYTTLFGLFFGIFILRYHFELILMTPLIAGFISYYVKISFNKESAVQSPERLYREKALMTYAGLCVLCFFILLFVNIPIMYEWFNVSQPQLPTLWVFWFLKLSFLFRKKWTHRLFRSSFLATIGRIYCRKPWNRFSPNPIARSRLW